MGDVTWKCVEEMEAKGLGPCPAYENCGPGTPAWLFVATGLQLLLRLREDVEEAERNQREEEREIQVLSLQAQMDLQKGVELLVGFGLIPHLLPDVGVPEKVRKRNVAAMEMFLQEDLRLHPLVKFHRLAVVLDVLLEVAREPCLSFVIVPKHTADVLAGLLQICHSPIAKPNPARAGSLSEEEYNYVMSLRDKFHLHLKGFVATIPRPLFISNLFLIGEKPKFMREVCTGMIKDILLSDKGLTITASTLLSEASESNAWSLAKIMGSFLEKALIGVPEGRNRELVLVRICEQCVNMCRRLFEEGEEKDPGRRKLNKEIARIGMFCGLVLIKVSPVLGKQLVWDELFKDVLHLEENAGEMVQGLCSNLVDCRKVIRNSEITEGLLSLILPAGISINLSAFHPLWSLSFRVYAACMMYLEKKVQDPQISQLAAELRGKLENVLLLLLEIVGAGAGESLDLDTCSGSGGLQTGNRVTSTPPTVISQERAKSVCEFCVELLVLAVNKFELLSNLGSSDLTEEEEEGLVKIGHKRQEKSFPSYCEQENNDKGTVKNETFEVLAGDCAILCSILRHERLAHITSQLFRQLLNYENEDVIGKDDGNSRRKETHKLSATHETTSFQKDFEPTGPLPCSSKELTQLEYELVGGNPMSDHFLRKFVAFKLLEDLGGDDVMIENCVKADDYKETLLIVDLVMKKLASELRESEKLGESYEFPQTVVFALGFLGTIVETACSTKESDPSNSESQSSSDEFWSELDRFIPHLKVIVDSSNLGLVDSGVQAMAENILLTIQTRGTLTKPSRASKLQVVPSQLEKALEDVANPMLPVKGHGLLQLRKLIEARDSETLQHEQKLLQIFQSELTNDDSYIYLMAIHGLAALGLIFHQNVVPILIQEYDIINPELGESDSKRNTMYRKMTPTERIERRMKIGEVLVKVVQQLGQIAPVYRVPLTNLFFRVVRDDEPMIKASALSNLGELCHLLKFSLGSVLTEVS